MLVALAVAGLQACRIDRQLDRRVGTQVQAAVVLVEVLMAVSLVVTWAVFVVSTFMTCAKERM